MRYNWVVLYRIVIFFCSFLLACMYMRESDCERAKGHKQQWCCPLFWWCRAGVWLYESRWVYYACLLPLYAPPRQKSCVSLCLFTEPRWRTVRCQVLLCRCVVPALSAIIFFIMFFACLSITAHVKKKNKKNRKRYWLLFMSTVEDLELQSWRSEWHCANRYERGGRINVPKV